MKVLATVVFVFILNSAFGQSKDLFNVQDHIQTTIQSQQDKSKQQQAVKQFRDLFKPNIRTYQDIQALKNSMSPLAGKMPTLIFQKPAFGLMPTITEKPVTLGKIPDSFVR